MIINIADSFVFNTVKNAESPTGTRATSAGESKLYIGHTSDRVTFDGFFNNYTGINCEFDKANLLKHIDYMLTLVYKITGTRYARDKLEEYYHDLKSSVVAHTDFTFSLESYVDPSRYYVRPPEADTDGITLWKEFFRKIAISKYSQLKIEKDVNNFTFLLEPLVSTTTSIPVGSMNKILYGAPGTGKSFKLQTDVNTYFRDSNVERINFYNGYTYGQFVGTYKPIPVFRELDISATTPPPTIPQFKYKENGSYLRTPTSEPYIVYEYIAGFFLKILIRALSDSDNIYCLIIEELNRAKVDAVFGDMFQLLDRNNTGESEYRVKCSDEMLDYIKTTGLDFPTLTDITENGLYIPNNLYLWATMNSADQGVFPMDTAFKRRWNFEYIGLNDSESEMLGYEVNLNNTTVVDKGWNNFRRTVNKVLSVKFGIAEDKLLAPFFVKKSDFDTSNILETSVFINKVIMYLKEDVLRHRKEEEKIFIHQQFSDIVDNYKSGAPIFSPSFITELNA